MAVTDELRAMAVSVGLDMPQAATLMMGAADAIEGLESNNAKLREQLAKARDPQRIGGTADPESFVYAIEQLREFRWQHATNDEDAIPYINNVAAAHERENAKLRELIADVHEALCADKAGVFHKLILTSMEDDMRELGVEVVSV